MDESPVQLRAWAERVLHGQRLADKLWSPARWADDRPGTAAPVPEVPGRPPGLAVSATERQRLPSAEALVDPRVRGRLLHAFANHELLALELMALALLRFPEAPAAFRRGLATTLAEEQRHLGAYLARMRALGVELGERPLGGFFWRVMAPMPSPLDFVAHMALTFEQANLDFALDQAARMRAAGDHETARILDEVRADEIGHVKLGLVWFERWRERGPSLFEAHRQALRPPTTLRRARGVGLDRAGRREAGLPDDYVEQLASFEASRGRPPVVHWFDPTAELELGTRGNYTPSASTRVMTADLELLPAFTAARHDVVLLRRAPSRSHLRTLAEAGLVVPEWIVVPEGRAPLPAAIVPHPRLEAVRPWGWSPQVRRRLGALVERSPRGAPPPASDALLHAKTTWVRVRAELSAALSAEPGADELEAQGRVVDAIEPAVAAIEHMHGLGFGRVVIKASFGTSGRNAQRVDPPGLTAAQRAWLSHTLAAQGAVVVEPWLDRQCDVSLRITVGPRGELRIDEPTRFLTDARGQYLGAVLGPLSRSVSPPIARMLNGGGQDPGRLERRCEAVAARVAALATQHGYAGPIGIDGLVYRDREGGLRLRSLVEVNMRPTLGFVAHGLERRLAGRRAGLWLLWRLADLPPGRGPGPQARVAEAIERARAVLPTVIEGHPPRLRQGVVPTTDPARALAVATVLLVTPDRALALRALHAAAPAVAARVREALVGQ